MRWQAAFSQGTTPKLCLDECSAQLDSDADLIFFFLSEAFSPRYELICDKMKEQYPKAVFLGGSASGLAGRGVETEYKPGIAMLAGRLPGVRIHPFHLHELPDLDGPPDAWREAVAPGEEEVKGIILLCDPFTFEAENTLAGLDFAYPSVSKVGGLVSGCLRAGEAALFCDQKLHRLGCVGVALAGPIEMKPAVAQGCQGFGKQYVVTESRGNIILQLDGKPATDAVSATLDGLTPEERRTHLHTALFIGLGAGQPTLQYKPGDFLVRQVLGADQRTGAVVVGGRVRNGQTVQFHLRNRKTSRLDLEQVLERAKEEMEGPVEAALLFSCLGRGQALYGEPSHDSRMFKKMVGDVPLGGFFCNGEIGPVGGVTSLHGFTSSFALFSGCS